MNGCMGTSDVKAIIEQVEQLLAEEELSERAEFAIHNLLNVVEALSADKKSLADEVERLRKQLEQKKKAKNTSSKDDKDTPSADGCDLFSPKVYGQFLSFALWNCLGVEGSVLLRDSNIVSRVSDQMPLNAITRIARIDAPVLTPHFMPAHLNRWLNTILQAASVTPLPIGTRSRRRSA